MNTCFYENLTSIVIPSRNIDFLLCKTVEKIRCIYNSVEIILILDEINENPDFKFKENIKILKSDNKNMSAKRNLGVKNSNSKYIAFLDSDAYPKENWLESAVEFLENNSNYSAVTGCQYNWETDNYKQRCLRYLRFNRLLTHDEWRKVIDYNSSEQDCTEFMTSNALIRRQDYINLKGMDEDIFLAEDNEFSSRLIKSGYKIRFIPKVSVCHREAEFYPFLRKVYCMGYYYSNNIYRRKKMKDFKHSITEILPLILILCFIGLYIFLYKININPNFLLVFPLIGFLIILKESFSITKLIEENKIKVLLFVFSSFILFCSVYIISLVWGILNLPAKKVQDCYKHY